MMNEFDRAVMCKRIHSRCKELHITHKQLAAKSGVSISTIDSWFRVEEKDAYNRPKKRVPKIDNLYQIAKVLDVSLDYLTGRVDFTNCAVEDMSEFTGLSNTAIECLHKWNLDRQQSQYSNEIETLNAILEYYGTLYKQKKVVGFSIFHFIGNFPRARNFKRAPLDLLKYRNGNHFEKIEVGDRITKKGQKKGKVIEQLCAPINSITNRGGDLSTLDFCNVENENEQYYAKIDALYPEYCKSQIIKEVEHIRDRKYIK